LKNWLAKTAASDKSKEKTYSGLIYRMFSFEPFKSWLGVRAEASFIEKRPARNLAVFTQIIAKFEALENISAANIAKKAEWLFTGYLKRIRYDDVNEYEDDSEYAPSKCVSFLTIHSAKGLEFPVVIMGLLRSEPRDISEREPGKFMLEAEKNNLLKRELFEREEDRKFFDYWRLYYTAFSRAQNLLVLACCERDKWGQHPPAPGAYLSEVYYDEKDEELPLPDYEDKGVREAVNKIEFDEVKDKNVKKTFAFTSHVLAYENCPLQYKFVKELGFAPLRGSSSCFGLVVHQAIEDLHHAIRDGEEDPTSEKCVKSLIEKCYKSLTKAQRDSLKKEDVLKQVMRYARMLEKEGKWHTIEEPEVKISCDAGDYFIKGAIDLIRLENNVVKIIDFKSGKRDSKYYKQYFRQLRIYAYLVREALGYKVSEMQLYYTGEEKGDPSDIVLYNEEEVNEVKAEFDKTVQKILSKEFEPSCKTCGPCKKAGCASCNYCKTCDFRFYCGF